MQELSCLQKACQTATNIMSQAEILQGRISGTPQKFFFDDFDLTPMLQERLKSLEGRNEEKYSNKRASIENCKEILELQKRCEEMKEQAVLIQKKNEKDRSIKHKGVSILKKNYRQQVLLIIANGLRLKKAILRLWYIAFKHCNKSLGGMFDGK